mmetsp:Transcript_14154/g.34042  ORF Transcript_14154/g.34042 Transcript_14154/m.34042 type:complete len:921 (-) Transcript_14154:224-2986(-)|eukprot:CAMPEP_0197586176 /NCGR_PEP_ID=MMETSP1326-20131121/8233_1 /TAXON_ID=1155430 /ORGANISM="Genus nov. species nov., Strain RCC2288" /LENGTH=920 /DNA_ID=CAMNT_0043150769 /DNA_START=373 /DNA_END=3135 /DNA_ORIENTATION=+
MKAVQPRRRGASGVPGVSRGVVAWLAVLVVALSGGHGSGNGGGGGMVMMVSAQPGGSSPPVLATSPPSPPPPNRDWTFAGGVYNEPVRWTNRSVITVISTVVIMPGFFLSIEEGTVIQVRPNCTSHEAVLWGVDNCGGANALPSIIIMPGAQLMAVGHPERPITFRAESQTAMVADDFVTGAWGGIFVLGNARLSQGVAVPASMGNHLAHFTSNIPSSVLPGAGNKLGNNGADLFMKYGKDLDEYSCGRVEYVRVLNGGGGGVTQNNIDALGFYGCGYATKIAHVEVAHSKTNGMTLSGGTASLKYVTVWNCGKDGIKVSNGYRGGMQYLFVTVPEHGGSAFRSEGTWTYNTALASDKQAADASMWRTHPIVYSSTFVAGDMTNITTVGTVTTQNGRYEAFGIVEVTMGSGLTLGNSIVLSTDVRPFGVCVKDCSTTMEVSHYHDPYETDKLWISPNNIIGGYGRSTGSAAKLAVFSTENATFRPYALSHGCEGLLNLADKSSPQLFSFDELTSSKNSSKTTMDPRPTNALFATSRTDAIPYLLGNPDVLADGTSSTKNSQIRGRHFTRTLPNVTFPGAFTTSPSSLWFAPWATHAAKLAPAPVLSRAYARLDVYDSAKCDRVINHLLVEQEQCYRASSAMHPQNANAPPAMQVHFRVEMVRILTPVASSWQVVMKPMLNAYDTLALCQAKSATGKTEWYSGVFDPIVKPAVCGAKNMTISAFGIAPGTFPSEDRYISVAWPNAEKACGEGPAQYMYMDAMNVNASAAAKMDEMLGVEPVRIPQVAAPRAGCYATRAQNTTSLMRATCTEGKLSAMYWDNKTGNVNCSATVRPTGVTEVPSGYQTCSTPDAGGLKGAHEFFALESHCGFLTHQLTLNNLTDFFGPFATYTRYRAPINVRREAYPWHQKECEPAKNFGYDV